MRNSRQKPLELLLWKSLDSPKQLQIIHNYLLYLKRDFLFELIGHRPEYIVYGSSKKDNCSGFPTKL